MGSSDKGTGVVDCGVGTIVWVRRRNGSWWPGKILGPEELSAAPLMSPRSGTPVKLLGREDASVDWYNLEKSKRVKAFRCGEFDDCIERAESSQGMPPKKREKYARREDAILHALELEKQLLEKKYGKLGCSSNYKSSKSSDAEEKELVASSECLGYGNSKHVQPKSHSKKEDSSLEDISMDHPLHAQKVKKGSQLAGDEDNAEVIPRMRGLQDFGLRIAPSKWKLSSSIALNGSRKPEFDNNINALPSGGISTENTIHAKSKISLDRRKRSHEMLTDESLVRRRDRRRPLVQVLRTSAMLSVHHSLHYDNDIIPILVGGQEQTVVTRHTKRSKFVELSGESSDCSDGKQICPSQMVISPSQFEESKYPESGVLGDQNTSESTETDSSETGSLDSDAAEEKAELSDVALDSELEPKPLERSGAQVQHGSISSEELDDLAPANNLALICPQDPVSASMGVSKWQLKRKRNNRGLAKRSISVNDRMVLRGSAYGKNHGETENNGCDEAGLTERNFTTRMSAFDNRGYLLTSKSTSKASDDISKNIIDWEDLAWNDQSVLKGYWKDSSNYFDPVFVGRHNFGGRMKSMWVDVDLKVQSSYQREHVPMISLMSKLNGKAIVGHPVQIEALEDGSSEILLSASDGICLKALDNDTVPSPMWRTARRTANFRVPRPHHSATLDGEETSDHFQCVGQDKKIPFKKSHVGSFGQKASVMRKTLSHGSRPHLDRKLSRKPPKRICSSSSQKIKTLSSIGAQQKLSDDLKCGTINYQVDGLIKGESGPTAVACIPVKLVFSRLYEELVSRHQ